MKSFLAVCSNCGNVLAPIKLVPLGVEVVSLTISAAHVEVLADP
jgi:hypothetical protein